MQDIGGTDIEKEMSTLQNVLWCNYCSFFSLLQIVKGTVQAQMKILSPFGQLFSFISF